jgi:hypothetical protein
VGCVRIFVGVDAGTGQGVQVSIDLKISVHARKARATSHVAGAQEPPSAELADQHLSDQQLDAPEDGPYIETLFGKRVPVSRLKTKRRRFGRRK